jgi:hypothetical protein
MAMNFGEQNIFLYNHSMVMMLPSLESLGIFGVNPDRTATYNLYVRCEDARGNKNVAEYNINFCVKPGEDHTAPSISGTFPITPYFAHNATSRNTTLYINEPATCRWAENDSSYDLMPNNFDCKNGFEQLTARGWGCSYNFLTPLNNNTNSTSEENKIFYVRCKDQPWFEENDSKRNSNAESFGLGLIRTSELRVDSVTPNNETIYISQEPASIELIARTSGGLEGAICFLKIGDSSMQFAEEEGNRHRNVFTSMPAGQQSIPIMCTDLAGNVAYSQSNFTVEIDSRAPIVTRVYNSNGLVVVTNENSVCSYANSIGEGMCDFTNRNTTQLSGNGLVHTTGLDRGLVYYVKCTDQFGNTPDGCSVVVQGGLI